MIRSEWIKLWSVRSTWCALYVAAVGTIGLAATYALVAKPGEVEPTNALQGAVFGQLAFGVLGVLVVSSEYTTGLIRTTFATVPRRRVVIAAKAGLLFAVLVVVGEVVSFAAFFTAQILCGRRGAHFSLAAHDMVFSVLGCGFYMAFVGMFGFCVGVVLQRTTAAVATFVGIVFVGMGVIPALLPDGVRAEAVRLTFTKVGEAMATPARTTPRSAADYVLGAGAAWGVCLLYLAVSVAVPLLIVTRRDTN
ncbi:ABC transporter permease [Catenulispora rubra]|uniref:ABC transporter permease n=1 Tax=Catenulispora rubra TaxID=280293 RepID=UPI0018925194|nr:ABC transporter permease [Catenulispora rubra]